MKPDPYSPCQFAAGSRSVLRAAKEILQKMADRGLVNVEFHRGRINEELC